MQRERILEIDGLRAVALLLVTAHHCGLAPFGWTGVWLFFVVSGFVIARGFESGAYAASTVGGAWLVFARRRFVRIVPIYVLYVAIAGVALHAAGHPLSPPAIAALLTFTYNWQTMFSAPPAPDVLHLVSHLWSLSVEEQFYLAFPVLALLHGASTRKRVLVAILATAPLVRLAWCALVAPWVLPEQHSYAVYAASFAHFDAFAAGALLARHQQLARTSPGLLARLVTASLVGLLAYTAVYVGLNLASGAHGLAAARNVFSGRLVGDGREALVYTLVVLVAAAAVVAALQGRLRWLAAPLVVWCGRISYGAYLYQGVVVWALLQVFGPLAALSLPGRLVLLAVALPVTLALAHLSFTALEEPLRRRFADGGERRAGASAR